MPLYYILFLYGGFGVLLFLFGGYTESLLGVSIDMSTIGYMLVDVSLSALLVMPIVGLYNRIKKRPYFTNWTRPFFYFSMLFFILSPIVLFFFIAV